MPVEESLEKRTIECLNSNSYLRQLKAVEALRYFKSEANIDRLNKLLEDTGYSERMNNAETRSKYYGARDGAYQTLKAWGIEVERPVVVELDNHQGK